MSDDTKPPSTTDASAPPTVDPLATPDFPKAPPPSISTAPQDSPDPGFSTVATGTLKPISRAPGFQKLRAMKCFEEFHQLLLEGWSPPDLARWIQDEKREYRKTAHTGLVSTIEKYRQSLPPGTLIQKRIPRVFHKAAEKVRQGVDEVQEIEDLVRLQKKRLKIDGNIEKRVNKLLPTMTQEVRTMREILQTLADVKMDLGLSKRHLGEMSVDARLVADVVGRYGSPAVEKVLNNPQSRQKVIGVAEKFLALAAHGEALGPVVDTTAEITEDPEAGLDEESMEDEGEEIGGLKPDPQLMKEVEGLLGDDESEVEE